MQIPSTGWLSAPIEREGCNWQFLTSGAGDERPLLNAVESLKGHCGVVVGLVLSFGLGGASVTQAATTCSDQVRIVANAANEAALRAALRARWTSECKGASIQMTVTPKGELLLAMTWRGHHNTRVVGTVDQALAWLDSWLDTPPLSAVHPRAATENLIGSPPKRPSPALRGRLQLSGIGAVGTDNLSRFGVLLSGRVDLLSKLWVGGSVAWNQEPVYRKDGIAARPMGWRAALRVGTTFDLSDDLVVSAGGGLGILNRSARGTEDGQTTDIEVGGPFIQVTTALERRLIGRLWLVGGVSLRLHDSALEPNPDIAVLAVEGQLGIAYGLGGKVR